MLYSSNWRKVVSFVVRVVKNKKVPTLVTIRGVKSCNFSIHLEQDAISQRGHTV